MRKLHPRLPSRGDPAEDSGARPLPPVSLRGPGVSGVPGGSGGPGGSAPSGPGAAAESKGRLRGWVPPGTHRTPAFRKAAALVPAFQPSVHQGDFLFLLSTGFLAPKPGPVTREYIGECSKSWVPVVHSIAAGTAGALLSLTKLEPPSHCWACAGKSNSEGAGSAAKVFFFQCRRNLKKTRPHPHLLGRSLCGRRMEINPNGAAQTHSGKLPGNQPVYRFGVVLSSKAWQESEPVSGAGFLKGK